MKRHPVCITSMHTAYATIDTTINHHVYKPDFFSLRSYFLDRKLGPVCHKIGGVFGLVFLLGQWLASSSIPQISSGPCVEVYFIRTATMSKDLACRVELFSLNFNHTRDCQGKHTHHNRKNEPNSNSHFAGLQCSVLTTVPLERPMSVL